MGQDAEREQRLREPGPATAIDAELLRRAGDGAVRAPLPAGRTTAKRSLRTSSTAPQSAVWGRGGEPPPRAESADGARDPVRTACAFRSRDKRPDADVSPSLRSGSSLSTRSAWFWELRGRGRRLPRGQGRLLSVLVARPHATRSCSTGSRSRTTLPWWGEHVHLDVPARETGRTFFGKHALPLDLRQQRRGRAWESAFPCVVPGSGRRRDGPRSPFVTLSFGKRARREHPEHRGERSDRRAFLGAYFPALTEGAPS